MFDIGASELLVIVIVAVLVIGPKDMPMALRTAGRWIGKVRRVSSHFRTGIDAMIREAELEDMEKKWKAQNEQIMARTPDAAGTGLPADEPAMTGPSVEDDTQAASAESRLANIEHDPHADDPAPASKAGSTAKGDSEPELPLGTSAPKS